MIGVNMPKYPNKDDIMNNPIPHKKEVLSFMKEWKKKFSPKGYHTVQAIVDLLWGLNKVYGRPNFRICPNDKRAYYDPKEHCIHLNNLSIVTALHEFAHSVYGRSERHACRWSVWLFRKIFPAEFEKLEFKGHLLVRPKPIINVPNTCQLLLPGLRPLHVPTFVQDAQQESHRLQLP